MSYSGSDLIVELVRTNFKLKYRGSVLGFLWVLMKPFFLFLIMYVIFSYLSRSGGGLSSETYAVYLLLGLVIFYFFNDGIVYGMNSLLDKSSIILKVNFNRSVAVLSSIILALINFIINMIIIAVVAAFVGVGASWLSFLYFVFIVVTLTMLILGMSYFSSILLVHLRDLTHVTELGMQLMFYASAVFFPVEIVPEQWRFLVQYNPIAAIIEAARNAILYGQVTRLTYVSVLFGLSIVLYLFGRIYFNKQVKRIAEYF